MSIRVLGVCGALVFLSACGQQSSPAQPSDAGGAVDASATASISVPRPLTPAVGAVIRHADQPVTLVVANAAITQGTPTYTFEVSTDPSFGTKAVTRSGVAQTSGQTALTIDPLNANTDYYWRARAEGGGTVGPFFPGRKLTIGPAIAIDPPLPLTPVNGSTTSGWPVFSVRNSTRTGPAGTIAYRFEIATNIAFSTIVLTSTVNETGTQTSFTPPSNLAAPSQTTLFWRATAIDETSSVSSPVSSVVTFVYSAPTRQSQLAAQQGLTLWTGAQPNGSNGQARMGPNWQVQTIRSFDGVVFVSPPIEALRIFDLLDRGYDPNSAIAWMNANGYPTVAVYYPSVQSIGLPFQYMALVGGAWELVTRVGA